MAVTLSDIQESKQIMSQLTKEQIKRYNRQIIVPSIGVKGQLKLLNAKVVVVGAGGLGKLFKA